MSYTEKARIFRKASEAAAQYAPDSVAVKTPALYALWQPDEYYIIGDKCRFGDALYKCRKAHTSQAHYPPDIIPALWEVINETHTGTRDDPIPAVIGMVYMQGLYYLDAGVRYICTRDSINPLYNLPHELVGHYFEVD